MKHRASPYGRLRLPPAIIQHAVGLYHRFNPSHRDIKDILAQRGVLVTLESIHLWCNKFGPQYEQRLRPGHRGYGDMIHMDEIFFRIRTSSTCGATWRQRVTTAGCGRPPLRPGTWRSRSDGDPSVSIDLLVRSLLALGTSRRELADIIAAR